MTRALGAACILTAAVWGWRHQAGERRRTQETLAELVSLLGRMGEEIHLRRTRLPHLLEAFSSRSGGDAARFLSAVAAELEAGRPLEQSWRRCAQALPLPAENRQILADLGDSLQGDEEQVCKAIQLTRDALAERLGELRARRAETEKRGAALWLSAGALVVILLI